MGLPGETYTPQHDHVGGSELQCQGTYSEARNGGHLLLVWRGWLENVNSGASPVWMSLDNGTPFTIGETETFVSPQVVPWGPDAFLVFHTGVDGNIWFTPVYADGSNSGTCYSVPGNTTNLAVSLAQMGNDSYNVYMVYRGVGNDLRVWGTWFGGPNGWSTPENISGGMANSAPAVVMNNVSNQLFVTAQGTDNKLWITNQTLGAKGWIGWTPQNSWNPDGTDTFNTAHMAVTSDGNMVISVWNGNSNPQVRGIRSLGQPADRLEHGPIPDRGGGSTHGGRERRICAHESE
jgi:hypothetical protein